MVYTDLLMINYTLQGSHLWKSKTSTQKEHWGGGRGNKIFNPSHNEKARQFTNIAASQIG